MSPEFVPSSVSQSLHYDYNQNQNVIFKQLPRTFLNISKQDQVWSQLCCAKSLSYKARWAGRGWLSSAATIFSMHGF